MEKNVSGKALKEISREKARIIRKRTVTPSSFLERAALAWKAKKDAEERQRQEERSRKEEPSGLSFRETVAKEIVAQDKQRLSATPAERPDEIGWTQYKPWQKEEDKNEKENPISMNTATVVAIRKKIIAAEWRRALGTPKKDNRFCNLEREAAILKERKEEAERKKEEIKMRIERHKEVLDDALTEFGKKLKEKKDTADPKELSALLEESLENAGEVFDIDWQETACLVWMEPWEEKRRRNVSGLDLPVIYRAKIDGDFRISSFEEVDDEEAIEGLREELLMRPLRESLAGISFNVDNVDEAKEFLEDKLTEIGRLISLERTEYGWLATIESWEEMRMRNTKRKGNTPVVTDEIAINWKDGKLEFVPFEEEVDDLGEEEDNTMTTQKKEI